MVEDPRLSRRAIVRGIVTAPILPPLAMGGASASPDAELLALARAHQAVPAALDCCSGHDEAMAVLGRSDELNAAMVAKRAFTVEGLRAKARATSWGILGEFDSSTEQSDDMRMVVSILRDLMQFDEDTMSA